MGHWAAQQCREAQFHRFRHLYLATPHVRLIIMQVASVKQPQQRRSASPLTSERVHRWGARCHLQPPAHRLVEHHVACRVGDLTAEVHQVQRRQAAAGQVARDPSKAASSLKLELCLATLEAPLVWCAGVLRVQLPWLRGAARSPCCSSEFEIGSSVTRRATRRAMAGYPEYVCISGFKRRHDNRVHYSRHRKSFSRAI